MSEKEFVKEFEEALEVVFRQVAAEYCTVFQRHLEQLRTGASPNEVLRDLRKYVKRDLRSLEDFILNVASALITDYIDEME